MFKDFLKKDLSTFFNIGEFAETHLIDGRQVNVIIDNDRLQHRSKNEYEGVHVGDLLYFARIEDFIENPKIDSIQVFGKVRYIIFDVRKSNGMYEIILKRNGS